MRLLTLAAGGADRAGLAAAVRSAAPDVVCLRRGPAGPLAPGRWAALARACGLYVAAGAPRGGTLVLVALRVAVLDGRVEVLGGRRPPVAVAVADLRCDGARWTVGSLALTGPPAEGRRQADELLYRLAEPAGTPVLAGWVGAEAAGAPGRLGERLVDVAAAAGRAPGTAVFVGRGTRAASCAVPPVAVAGLPPALLCELEAVPPQPAAAEAV